MLESGIYILGREVTSTSRNVLIGAASVDDGDFLPFMMTLTFPSGSSDGNMACANITVLSDNMVEFEESLSVELNLENEMDSLSIGNRSTTVKLLDSDGI